MNEFITFVEIFMKLRWKIKRTSLVNSYLWTSLWYCITNGLSRRIEGACKFRSKHRIIIRSLHCSSSPLGELTGSKVCLTSDFVYKSLTFVVNRCLQANCHWFDRFRFLVCSLSTAFSSDYFCYISMVSVKDFISILN